jgi:signal transduction histidine kinase
VIELTAALVLSGLGLILALCYRLRREIRDLTTFEKIAGQLSSPPFLQPTANAVSRIARDALIPVDACLFFLSCPEDELLTFVGGDWKKVPAFDAQNLNIAMTGNTPLMETFRSGREMIYEAGAAGTIWEGDPLLKRAPYKTLIYLPLLMDRQAIGVMALGLLKEKRLSSGDMRLARVISRQATVVLEHCYLFERLRTANEKLEQINQLKNEFVSMVSHELRTPLTTIKGFVSIVLDGEVGPLNLQQQKFLDNSHRAIERLTLLVSDLLDISRIEAGQLQMHFKPIDLKDLVQKAGANFAHQIKNLEFILNVPEVLPPIMGDPQRLMQVLDNLVANAIKFTSRGSISIAVFDKGDYVIVSVRDSGEGIPFEEQANIFKKFYQVKTGGVWPGKGTGLGLAIVKAIVEGHHGKIWVESEPGKGSDFRIILPRAHTDLSVRAFMPL